MADSDLDMDEVRANPDALKLYVMRDYSVTPHRTYLCAGTDAVQAAQNLVEAYGLIEDLISVSQGFVMNDKFARIAETEFGSLLLKREA